MNTLAKTLLILATLVTVVLVGTFVAVALFGHSENTSLAFHWLSVTAVILWIPVAGISILAMAITSKAGGAPLPGKRSVIEWGIPALLFLLSLYLVNSSYSSVWQGMTEGWYSSPVLRMLTLAAGLATLVASVASFLRHKWAQHLLLLCVLALFAMSNYETLSMFHATPFISFLVSAAAKNFMVMVVLASYIYLRQKSEQTSDLKHSHK
jgi:hypothetical protein